MKTRCELVMEATRKGGERWRVRKVMLNFFFNSLILVRNSSNFGLKLIHKIHLHGFAWFTSQVSGGWITSGQKNPIWNCPLFGSLSSWQEGPYTCLSFPINDNLYSAFYLTFSQVSWYIYIIFWKTLLPRIITIPLIQILKKTHTILRPFRCYSESGWMAWQG